MDSRREPRDCRALPAVRTANERRIVQIRRSRQRRADRVSVAESSLLNPESAVRHAMIDIPTSERAASRRILPLCVAGYLWQSLLVTTTASTGGSARTAPAVCGCARSLHPGCSG